MDREKAHHGKWKDGDVQHVEPQQGGGTDDWTAQQDVLHGVTDQRYVPAIPDPTVTAQYAS